MLAEATLEEKEFFWNMFIPAIARKLTKFKWTVEKFEKKLPIMLAIADECGKGEQETKEWMGEAIITELEKISGIE